MRLLLDENVPVKLKQDLTGHTVYTVRELRRDGREDEEVLQLLVDFNFDALITCDKNLRFQQNLSRYTTPVVVLDTYTNAYLVLRQTVPNLLSLLQQALPAGATIVKP
ncbi:DUF5615 family PIN-like protein [Spirosoma montaniterrae]|uniref:DUF5615 domain-containing protein n=1 Tax=Spirosoma montaniterrae TaxID=1178516 RepID=A0A1P9WVZ3_9BACT|nr:DUF5615 family PIN-like protein [Spirosoma montaniterrae]AQG79552.1 hypothetical protein AWR27_09585 [Spirosoma montaniterrae]